jgi:hypothetical protein
MEINTGKRNDAGIENPRVGGSIPPQATKNQEINQRVSGLGF